ncbi:hypothetical protein AAFF_G00042310 [Aldrovandia affinis]|uniref:Uncharacterized protein n=1 Tax=Aldrovandia affinis TaxID=143900 RepID=A0AAD7S2R9_9TELE|nr:hypothetical protein AAFF_G00042310 [Aldrovandia affinis]
MKERTQALGEVACGYGSPDERMNGAGRAPLMCDPHTAAPKKSGGPPKGRALTPDAPFSPTTLPARPTPTATPCHLRGEP